MGEFVFMRLFEEVIHIQERVRRVNDEGLEGKIPFEIIQPSGEGVGENEIIVNEFAIWATSDIGDAPAESFHGAGEDLADAAGVLQADCIGVNVITEAAGLNDGKEAPANLGFFLLAEFYRDDPGWEGPVEHGPETFAHAGGVDDDVLGMPGFGEGLDFATDGKVVFADPTVAGDNVIGRALERGKAGEVDLDDGKGGGVTAGVAKAVT